jgi:hypothetical protein
VLPPPTKIRINSNRILSPLILSQNSLTFS